MSRRWLLCLVACATPTKPPPERPGSRGLRASEHLEAAREQDELAAEATRWPDVPAFDSSGRPAPGVTWYRTWDTTDHERMAQVHRSASAALHAEYQQACGDRENASDSPLARYATGGVPIADGVVLYLSPDAGPPDRLLADMRCHRAWMMLAPSDMEMCPLDLAGIHVDAHGDATAVEVTITVRDRALVPELQRRVAHELEVATSLHR
jgi:hypothetical protein